jgi:MFS family permease
VIIPFTHSLFLTIALLTFSLACISSITGNAWGLAGDVAPASKVASLGALQNFGGYFGGTFSPILAGFIVDATGSYSLAFISGGIIAACSALCYLLILRKPIEPAEWKRVLKLDHA